MTGRARAWAAVVAVASLAACGGDDDTATAATTTASVAAPTTVASGATSTAVATTVGPTLCRLVDAARLAELFPGSTPGEPTGSPTQCVWGVEGGSTGVSGTLLMQPLVTSYDESREAYGSMGEVRELEGVAERSFYVAKLAVFEKAGRTYAVQVVYRQGPVDPPAEPVPADAIKAIAAAYAASL